MRESGISRLVDNSSGSGPLEKESICLHMKPKRDHASSVGSMRDDMHFLEESVVIRVIPVTREKLESEQGLNVVTTECELLTRGFHESLNWSDSRLFAIAPHVHPFGKLCFLIPLTFVHNL
jgi:hypothetical protein